MKSCVECGCQFTASRAYSRAQWEARRFCGAGCYRANRRGRPVVQINRPSRRIRPVTAGGLLPFWRELLEVHHRVMQAPRHDAGMRYEGGCWVAGE